MESNHTLLGTSLFGGTAAAKPTFSLGGTTGSTGLFGGTASTGFGGAATTGGIDYYYILNIFCILLRLFWAWAKMSQIL